MTFTVFDLMMLFLLGGGELATLVDDGAFFFEMFITPFIVDAGAEEEIDTTFFVLENRSNPPIPFA
jgi:hypothetical protein